MKKTTVPKIWVDAMQKVCFYASAMYECGDGDGHQQQAMREMFAALDVLAEIEASMPWPPGE